MTLESLETTRTMIFVAIFSAEKDGGMKTSHERDHSEKNQREF